ncbi:ATP phosphoribosyltransferase regulatory subunit, divergent variant [hydrothermal vent metagenome]|uniref:ATP phosphoribosyltransferase regulatory subunit, divergent variant n=1 Tax=hydrothermal vent metagenome TaxID=652676 RepID=A0A1W1CBM2_9ZZZZ
MIFEHEIPNGSKLYFGKSAKIKRDIENIAGKTLEDLGFEEIVTPLFSYHQHESFKDIKPLIRLNDEYNHQVTLRADSTADVVRIATKRLGRSMESKKWFYIQPIVSFPTQEQYQVGAEVIDGNFEEITNNTITLLKKLELSPTLQLANIQIPHLLNQKYGIPLEWLEFTNIEEILNIDLPWIEKLVRIHKIDDLDDLTDFPADIIEELEKIKSAVSEIDYDNIIISPLYYAKMRYYDSLMFKMFDKNSLLARGGSYNIEGIEAVGFALYTDECIAQKMNRN